MTHIAASPALRVLVTGGGVGIGRAIAGDFAGRGHAVAATYLIHPPTGLPFEPRAERVDFRDPDAAMAAVARLAVALGGVDVLVNNVGGLLGRVPIADMTPEHWREVIAVNLHSVFYATAAALPHLTDQRARVINVSSLAAQTGGGAGSVAYAAAKAGMLGFTRGLAKELAPRGITVNAVAPGFIEGTPFHDTHSSAQARRASIEAIPLHRAGRPADVAEVVSWLASTGSGFVTGACIDINGGQWFT